MVHRTLLIVDDEPHIESALRRLLRKEKYQILSAQNGADALNLMAKHRVDVILSDERMPGMSGVDLLVHVQKFYPEVVRVLMSGYADLKTVIHAINESGVHKVVTKPWNDREFREHLREAFCYRDIIWRGAQLDKVFDSSIEGILITDSRGAVQSVNPAFTKITGYTSEEILGRFFRVLRSNRHDAEFIQNLWDTVRDRGLWYGEVWERRKNKEIYPQWLSITAIRDARQKIVQYVFLFIDITQQKENEYRIEHQAHHDDLTGLPNRVLFHDRLRRALAQARRNRRCLALFFLDLDHFKDVNDTLGHPVGDQLLQEVARRLPRSIRDEDTVARQGGDEFTVLLPQIMRREDAEQVARKIFDACRAPVVIDHQHELHITPSVGISIYPEDGEDAETLMKHADVAMYRAKELGRNTFQFYAPAMELKVCKMLKHEDEEQQGSEASQISQSSQSSQISQSSQARQTHSIQQSGGQRLLLEEGSFFAADSLEPSHFEVLVPKFESLSRRLTLWKQGRKPDGFLKLPYQEDLLATAVAWARRIRESAQKLIVFGIGGSSLGAKMLVNALGDNNKKDYFPIVFCDDIDPEKLSRQLSANWRETFLLVISKSGVTAEILAQLLTTLSVIEKELGEAVKISERVAVITDINPRTDQTNALKEIAQHLNLPIIPHPPVGGRFSVLSIVGLLPAAVAGVDLGGLVAGAREMAEEVSRTTRMDNPAFRYGAAQYFMGVNSKPMSLYWSYGDRLKYAVLWQRQLWAESLGKRKWQNGDRVGLTPIVAHGVMDQHSQLQLYLDGPMDKQVTLLYDSGLSQLGEQIPNRFQDLQDLPAVTSLAGSSMGELFDAQFRSVREALIQQGLPVRTIHLPGADARSLGAWIILMETEAVVVAELFGVNAFDQPAVEKSKKRAYALLAGES